MTLLVITVAKDSEDSQEPSGADRDRLARLARLPSVPSGLARRARIVLLAADGMPNAAIARAVGVSRPTVIGWRDRYQAGGIQALEDELRSGRPRQVDEAEVVLATLADGGRPPGRLGITHWSARLLAAELGISFSTVARVWRKWGIQPHRVETFKFSTDPQLEPKIRDVVGLYLNPPENAVVVSVDEKWGQALRAAKEARRAYLVLDGTLIAIDRVAADRPFYSGKHKKHGMNLQVIATPEGDIVWVSPPLRGRVHDIKAARIWGIIRELRDSGLITLADKGYTGAGSHIAVPYRGRGKPPSQKSANRAHARLRAPGERANAELKTWRILRKLRCCPWHAGRLTKSIHVLQTRKARG